MWGRGGDMRKVLVSMITSSQLAECSLEAGDGRREA